MGIIVNKHDLRYSRGNISMAYGVILQVVLRYVYPLVVKVRPPYVVQAVYLVWQRRACIQSHELSISCRRTWPPVATEHSLPPSVTPAPP